MAINTKLFLLSLLLSATLSLAYYDLGRPGPDPERDLQQCQKQCETQAQHQTQQQQQQRCERDCQKQYQQSKQSEQQQGPGGGGGSQEEEQQGDQNSPYLFRRESFGAKITSPHGNVTVLQRFDKRSELLRGIENYRVTFFEAQHNAFMLPHHWDADTVTVVLNGCGSITIIQQQENHENKRETHNVKPGDIIRLYAGATVHFVNTDKNQKFTMVELAIPVNTPGHFESFFPAASRDQESYFNALSDEVLQAAFNVDIKQLRKLFQGQKEGQFVRVSEQQIRALSERSSESLPWPFHQGGRRSSRPYNLFNEHATQSNQYGQLYEINPEKYKQLQDVDIQVSYANISRGAMIAPSYNSRATKIAVVVSGTGYFEMACTHLSKQQSQGGQQQCKGGSQQQQKGTKQYQKASEQIRAGDVFVAPAGHPVVTIASNDQNLEVLCYEIGAENNERVPLAGRNNVLSQLQDVAKEISFNTKASEVNDILKEQKETWFFPGPQQGKQHQGYAAE